MTNLWDAHVFSPFFGKIEKRVDVLDIVKPGGIGIELGVAEGQFSAELLDKRRLSYLYSIDMYAGDGGHDVSQYIKAFLALEPYKSTNSLIKMRFDEALRIFPDSYFDFIYVDGYAHTGEEGGGTFRDWYPKLKSGGVFAGHDYATNYAEVIKQVDVFCGDLGKKPNIINDNSGKWNNGCPSWFIVKD